LQNGGKTLVSASLTDYLAASLVREPVRVTVEARAGETTRATYEALPRERGDVVTGEVIVEWRSAWRLLERWVRAPLEQTVRVYPDLHEARRHSMYLIRSQQVAIERRRARLPAAGREFDRLRDYRPGDERRNVAWHVSARRGHLVTRLYQPERSQTVWLLIDAGRLLRARAGDQTLLDRTATAAATVAQVAMGAGDNVGLVAYGRRVQHRLSPARGAAQMRRLTEALALVRGEPVEANHAAAAAALRSAQPRRALIVWLTEIAETAGVPEVVEYALTLVPGHVVLFATMRQPDLAAASGMSPATPGEMYRVVAAQEAVTRREALLRSLRQRGALVVQTSPDELSRGLVDRYLEVKERGRL